MHLSQCSKQVKPLKLRSYVALDLFGSCLTKWQQMLMTGREKPDGKTQGVHIPFGQPIQERQ